MKAAEFAYERPGSLREALDLLADPDRDGMPLAGGQSLMPMMNFRMAQPGLLVDLGALDELRGIAEAPDGGLWIGAMTRYADLAASDLVTARAPLIAMALPQIAHAAIRNRGTIGGSVALADPAAEMPALMLALDAQITVTGPGGGRSVPAAEFFLGIYETALDEGELVTGISLPASAPNRRFAFHELARRHGDYALAGVALAATGPAGSACTDWRVALFGVADCATRARGSETALDGQVPMDGAAQAIAALQEIEFSGDLNAEPGTKRHLAGVVLKRALERL